MKDERQTDDVFHVNVEFVEVGVAPTLVQHDLRHTLVHQLVVKVSV